jgi:plastocyanin
MKTSLVRALTLVFIFTSFAALLAACSDDDSTAPPTNGPFTGTIQVRDDFFSPSNVTISVGDSVTWHWAGSHDHSVTEGTTLGGAHAFDSGVKTSGTFGMRFNSASTVHYFCQVHFSTMKGTIVVEP